MCALTTRCALQPRHRNQNVVHTVQRQPPHHQQHPPSHSSRALTATTTRYSRAVQSKNTHSRIHYARGQEKLHTHTHTHAFRSEHHHHQQTCARPAEAKRRLDLPALESGHHEPAAFNVVARRSPTISVGAAGASLFLGAVCVFVWITFAKLNSRVPAI